MKFTADATIPLHSDYGKFEMQPLKTIDNEMINLIKLDYILFELQSTRPKFDV